MPVSTPPAGFHSVTPYFYVDDPAAAMRFYREAFGAEKLMQLTTPGKDGGEVIVHAEIRIGDSILMLSGEWPDMNALGPNSRGGATCSFMIYVPDADAAFAKAVAAGAEVVKPVADQFYGDRTGTVRDPFGHSWSLGTHIEDVDEAEGQRRMEAM